MNVKMMIINVNSGPIKLEKLHIKLYDDNNILELNNHYSFL